MSAAANRTRFRSSTWGSLQTLTRALRESLRLRKLRKQKRLRNEANDQMRGRSKSVGNAYDDEISDVGISVAVASDIGPIINQVKLREQQAKMVKAMPKRRQSKSVDDVELAAIKKSIDEEMAKSAMKLSPNAYNGQHTRRRSKDDHDIPSKVSKESNLLSEQKGLRKRFGRLFGSLHRRQHSQLKAETPSPSSASEEETSEEKSSDKSNVKNNDDVNTTNEESNNDKRNNGIKREQTTVEDRTHSINRKEEK